MALCWTSWQTNRSPHVKVSRWHCSLRWSISNKMFQNETNIKILQLEIIDRESTEKEALCKIRKLKEVLEKEKVPEKKQPSQCTVSKGHGQQRIAFCRR